jgi:hypothetical protein
VATLLVASDATEPELGVLLTAVPVDSQCAVAEIDSAIDCLAPANGDLPTIPCQVALEQKCSDPAGGAIATWEWTVTAPDGAATSVTPDAWSSPATFQAGSFGTWTVKLACTTKAGCSTTKTSHLPFEPAQGCRVDLTWDTPADPDQTDTCKVNQHCGADMDLHVVHPDAKGPDLDGDGRPDGFFDWGQDGGLPGDCMWLTKDPCWVATACDDEDSNPHLTDDTDGAGPETFVLKKPGAGLCYRVGVHYWRDYGFGTSYPTVRAWVDGHLAYASASAPAMVRLDMWEVGEFCCSAGTFTPYTAPGGGPVIVHGYVNPSFDFTR